MAKGGGTRRWVEKHIINPFMRTLFRLGVAPRAFALLETKGRQSHQPRLTPVGSGLDGSTCWLVAEHGRGCDYVKNLMVDPRVRVKVNRRWHSGTATVMESDDGHIRRRALDTANGVIGRVDGVLFRAAATTTVTIRIDLDE